MATKGISLSCYTSTTLLYSHRPCSNIYSDLVLGRLKTEGLKVKLGKCAFFQEEVSYLGHVISSRGVVTDPKKIEAVAQWPHPTTVSELRTFLGFVSYYRRFVEGFAKLAAPLHKVVAMLTGGKSSKRGQEITAVWSE